MSGLITVLAFAGFIGVCWWAYSKRNRERFERAGYMPLEDDTQSEQR